MHKNNQLAPGRKNPRYRALEHDEKREGCPLAGTAIQAALENALVYRASFLESVRPPEITHHRERSYG